MKRDAQVELVDFWKQVYDSKDPLAAIRKEDGQIPAGIVSALGAMSQVYPEPYYGYFDDDMTDDVLLMFINPGQTGVGPQQLNSFIQERYSTWTKDDYLGECARFSNIPNNVCKCRLSEISPEGCRWRRARWKSFEHIIGEKINFMHTMEFLPYHSKRWAELASFKDWIFSRETTRLAINAIVSMAQNRRLKHIVGIGMPWYEIFSHYGFKPVDVSTITLPGRTNYSQRFFKYMFSSDATPVIISVMGGGFIRLPKNPIIVDEMRQLLNI